MQRVLYMSGAPVDVLDGQCTNTVSNNQCNSDFVRGWHLGQQTSKVQYAVREYLLSKSQRTKKRVLIFQTMQMLPRHANQTPPFLNSLFVPPILSISPKLVFLWLSFIISFSLFLLSFSAEACLTFSFMLSTHS